jgi:hypothetical protein
MIVDMPNKVAWNGNRLYLEAHPPLEEHSSSAELSGIVSSIEARVPRNHTTLINWQLVAYISEEPDGIPHDIGVMVN